MSLNFFCNVALGGVYLLGETIPVPLISCVYNSGVLFWHNSFPNFTKHVAISVSKHRNPATIVFVDSSKQHDRKCIFCAILHLRSFLASPRNMIAFVGDGDNLETQTISFYYIKYLCPSPPLKVYVNRLSYRTFLLCRVHSGLELFASHFVPKVPSILELHKSIWFTAANLVVQTKIEDESETIFDESKHKKFKCVNHLRNRDNYEHFTSYCWAGNMVEIELSLHHNVSYVGSNLTVPNGTFQHMRLYEKGITALATFPYSIYHQYFTAYHHMYCQNYRKLGGDPGRKTDWLIWVKPVSMPVWILLMVSTFISCTIYQFNTRNDIQFFNSVATNIINAFLAVTKAAVHLTQSAKRPALTVTVSFPLIFFWWRYEVAITSLVTVKEPEIGMTTNAELQAAGFRLLVANELCKYSNLTTFQECEENHEYGAKSSYVENKLAFEVSGKYMLWNIVNYGMSYKQLDPIQNIKCYTIPESFKYEQWFYVVDTVNRFWMFRTISWLQQSGLTNIYDDWVLHSFILFKHGESFIPKKENLPDLIDLKRFLPVLAAHFLICFCSVVMFGLEKIS